jgi:DNA-binding beta-propeller fold protein YncE
MDTVNSTNLQKYNQESKMTDSKELKECKIIDTIAVTDPRSIIPTLCGKFLIGVEGHSIFRYCLETKQKFRIAGSVSQYGYKDGTRDESRFIYPCGLTLSKNGETLFFIDYWNHVIRDICVETGITTTFAGQVDNKKIVDGPKEKACFQYPRFLKLSPDGNTLYVADWNKLRSICIETGQVDTFETFEKLILDFTFSQDNKYMIISNWTQILKYNLETSKSELILKGKNFGEFDITKDGQFLFLSIHPKKRIEIVNLDTNQVIDTITTPFKPYNTTISTNSNQLYISDIENHKIQVLDISKYCKTFE